MQISGGVKLSGGINLAPGGSGGSGGASDGYASGGESGPGTALNIIHKFSFFFVW